MLFNSIAFSLFAPIVFACYWIGSLMVESRPYAKKTYQNIILIVASYVFYGWLDCRICFLLLLVTGSAYVVGGLIGRCQSDGRQKTASVWMWSGVAMCLIVLGIFKYYNFFIESINALSLSVGIRLDIPTLRLVLPIGISFYTFMSISYVVDVRRKLMPHDSRLVDYFACMSFFPQLLAGPIGRTSKMIHQFSVARRFDIERAETGLFRLLVGLVKKVVVADTLAGVVDKVFSSQGSYDGLVCLVGALLFSLQIYCDFSGYSDMAVGVGKLFSIDLIENFDRPYRAASVADFWRRWHISLSTWFRDYVYIPLGGNRVGLFRLIANTWIVFLLSGLWHGAGWTFVAWGAIHAFCLTVEICIKRFKRAIGVEPSGGGAVGCVKVACTVASVCVAWIFFKAKTLDEAVCYSVALFTKWSAVGWGRLADAAGGTVALLMCVVAFAIGSAYDLMPKNTSACKVARLCICVFSVLVCDVFCYRCYF